MLMTMNDIYQTYQSQKGGSSGRGNSFYSSAASCGRRARLEEEDRQVVREFQPAKEPTPFGTGTAYHFFHQLAGTKQLADGLVVDMTDTSVDADFLEGLRLFRGWQSLWGSIEQKYGEVLAVELPVEFHDPDQEEDEEDEDGGFTGRLDCLVDIQDTQGVQQRTGLHVEPGIYIVDWKSAKGESSADNYKFTQGTQARGYLMMKEAKGVIFDVLYKHKSFIHQPRIAATGKVTQGKSYAHYFQPPQHDDKHVIDALIQIGKHNYDNNLANPAECLRGFEPCKYFLNGRCGGF